MKITRTSIISGKKRTFDLPITEEQCIKFGEGMLIQDAFPYLTASEREFIMTGITDKEWKDAFGEEDPCVDPDSESGFDFGGEEGEG
jgi:hypothetical protein